MSGKQSYWVIVAESSPVIRLGLTSCLRRLPGLSIQPVEAHSYEDIVTLLHPGESHPAPSLIIVNPTFGGSFNPAQLRATISEDIKIVAIETIHLDKYTLANYDGTIAIVDDLATIASKLNALLSTEADYADSLTYKDLLSAREKEVVALVVKGLTNKEIADRLFLSVYTVMTHRRNISRKLEIHSATGLTIYAIVNKLVDLSDVKL